MSPKRIDRLTPEQEARMPEWADRRVIEDSRGCWIWSGAINNGYGRAYIAGRLFYAHRVVYEVIVGPIPEGLELDHLCRVRACVNPAHLEPVTRAENLRRGLKGELTTRCPAGHPYDGANTRKRSNGHRVCRACHREREAIRRTRKVA